jgi:hypothetical protein
MKRLLKYFLFAAIIAAAAGSCYYDSEEGLYPSISQTCDTTNVTYSGSVVPILANNCLSCHSNAAAASAGGNIPLENYTDVSTRAAAISGAINHSGGHSPMPKNGAKLKACLISTFDIWVRKGKLNN